MRLRRRRSLSPRMRALAAFYGRVPQFTSFQEGYFVSLFRRWAAVEQAPRELQPQLLSALSVKLLLNMDTLRRSGRSDASLHASSPAA